MENPNSTCGYGELRAKDREQFLLELLRLEDDGCPINLHDGSSQNSSAAMSERFSAELRAKLKGGSIEN